MVAPSSPMSFFFQHDLNDFVDKYVTYKCLVWSELQYIGGVVHDHLSYKSVVFGAVICEIFYVNQAVLYIFQ